MLGRMMHGRQMERMMTRLAHELAQGVFYRVKRGDDEVILHCPQNMALNACVTGATELLKGMGEAAEDLGSCAWCARRLLMVRSTSLAIRRSRTLLDCLA